MNKPMKLLIVDDEEGIVDYMQRTFKRRGYDTFGTTIGKTAIDIFEYERPEISIIDVVLDEPTYNGIQVLEKIKEIDKDAVCVMVTRVTDQDMIEKARELGALHYILKPLDIHELVEIVEEAKSVVESRGKKSG